VQFIDSAGLRMLVGLVNDLDDRGARLRLVVAETSPIARVLSITNFESLMPIDTSVGDACRAIMEPTDSTDPATPPETT
jgi:anti-anti-sigma factor